MNYTYKRYNVVLNIILVKKKYNMQNTSLNELPLSYLFFAIFHKKNLV